MPKWKVFDLVMKGVIGIGVIAAVIGTIMYAQHFSQITTEHHRWGEFGDYFGGFVGTVLSAMAFTGLIWSMVIQQRNARIRDIQGMLAYAIERLDNERAALPRLASRFDDHFNRFTIGHLLVAMNAKDDPDHIIADIKRMTLAQFVELAARVNEVALLLTMYRDAGGEKNIFDMYTGTYTQTAQLLAKVGRLHSDFAQKFFNAKNIPDTTDIPL